ncbi:uncharacterized protein LOC106880714 [Octopus bimaculoides]|uniref:uncharacterized protein LOC106880714 n=1 Tax=Octopus bimaculoides TaxID=37653 RepID=UPI00071DB098|nr:uncharacterized protein LOC106880714 [Octopus bimaculoides]|eukprot:XP_014786275.1 PREDICTED: uncharacterized protein LOC106880714 [Octopus bimaculoides]
MQLSQLHSHFKYHSPSHSHLHILRFPLFLLCFDYFDYTFLYRTHHFVIVLVSGSRQSFLLLPYTCLSRPTMLVVLMLLMMASYISTPLEIADMKPSETIDLGYTTGITITCRHNLKNFIHFALVQNQDYVVFKVYRIKEERRFKTVTKRKGFDCTLDFINKDEIICWKFNPACEDATYYTCKTNLQSSKPKVLKNKLYNANIITKILIFATALLFISNLHEVSRKRKTESTRLVLYNSFSFL